MKPFASTSGVLPDNFPENIKKLDMHGKSHSSVATDQTATTIPEPSPTLEPKGNLSQIKPKNVATFHPSRAAAMGNGRDRGGASRRAGSILAKIRRLPLQSA